MIRTTTKRFQMQAIAIALLAGAFLVRGVMCETETNPTFLKFRVTMNLLVGDYDNAAKLAQQAANIQNES